jgi:Fe-Mn family superoxide dismutase
MKKREFIRTSGMLALGAMLTPSLLGSCDNPTPEKEVETKTATIFELPKLEYAFDALEPHIDAQTMEIHHGKHHAGYVKKLNAALEGHPLAGKTLEEILANLKDSEKDIAVRNNAGGHYNHSLFWRTIGPNAGGEPKGALGDAIKGSFDSFENFKTKFSEAAGTLFGSGWAWLTVAGGKLVINQSPNQDNPLMKGLVEQEGSPILGLDVWEHAYYLNYQNRRPDYISAFWNLINWEEVSKNYAAAK